ncbi:DUF4493 domain-containing protein [Phocaeicola sp. HCN-6420]|uniref:DUF4493 domain-containing protein n=1 Tax=Phocaeicola sp. HCN-6420 TaxID=3134673 RepID=UPI0030BC3865
MNKSISEYIKWIGCLCSLVLGTVLGGCQSDEEAVLSGKTGLLVTLTDEENNAYSRTAPSGLKDPLMEMFQLKVVFSGTDKSAYKGSCKESILLLEGLYDLTATYGDNPVIALDAPYYVGSLKEQEVIKGQMTSASISCSVANSLLSVIYNKESLNKLYESYYVTVSVGGESVDLDADSGKSAYFRAGSSVNLVFHGRLLGTGKEVTYNIPDQEKFANIPVKTHVKVTLGLDESGVSSGIGVSIEKLETETVSISETIPVEYLPKPKLESDDFVNNTLSFAETEKKSAVIRLKLSSALQELKLKFNSADAKFAGLEQGREYLLSNAKDKLAVETALGIALPEIGATEGSLDFTSLIPQLMTDKGATVASTVEVDVEANNRWASEDASANRVYTLTCNKPEFSVSAYPGNIWTKEFTVSPLSAEDVKAGDYELLGQKMKYQFSADGENDWTDLGDDLRKDGLNPGTMYYIRGVYRDEIYSDPVAVSTYSVVNLENGGLEGAKITRGTDSPGFFGADYGALYAWDNWATLNAVSACYCFRTAYSFNSRSGCRPTSDAVSGEAVRIITLGYKGGSWAVPQAAMHSELFLGTSADDDGNRSYGISYNSHPTALRFYYKCIENVLGNDLSLVQIQIFHDDTLLGQGEFRTGAQDSYVEKVLDILYEEDVEKLKLAPNKLLVLFKSGIKENLNWETDLKNFNTGGTTDKTADATFRGNELFIDDVSLVYDK